MGFKDSRACALGAFKLALESTLGLALESTLELALESTLGLAPSTP